MTVNAGAISAGTDTEPVARGRRFAWAGSLSGIAGAICCVGNALALGAGIGGLSFFGTWMQRYQPYFILASLVAMAIAAVSMLRRYEGRATKRMLRHVGVMVAAYVLTLGVATLVSGLVSG